MESPHLQTGFPANTRDLGNPNDNDIAVSKGGKIMSVVNTNVSAYEPNGLELFSMSLEAFTPGTGNNQKFDPRMLYDPVGDRFIFVCLNGFSPNTSEIILAFSTSNDPQEEWHVYSLPGNFELVSQVDVWSDFPQVGTSQEELFVALNLFNSRGEGQGTGVYQIDLGTAYAGQDLLVATHALQGTFSISPVLGAVAPTGPNMFFVDVVGEGGERTVFLHEMTNTIQNGGRFNAVTVLQSNLTYRIPPDSPQKGTEIRLENFDCRVHSAFMIEDKIYFAFNSGEAGMAGIYLGEITISPFVITFSTVTGRLILHERYDLAFPRIVYGGCSSEEGHAILMMTNISSPDTFPGNAVFHIDTLGDVSEPTVCAVGNTFLGTPNPDSLWRWGDYTGISSPSPGEVWVAGYTVSETGKNNTRVSQLFNPGCSTIPQPPVIDETSLLIYPNPAATDFVKVKAKIKNEGFYRARIFDLGGRFIHQLIEGNLQAGEAVISFSTDPLASGMYLLSLEKGEERILTEKFVVVKE